MGATATRTQLRFDTGRTSLDLVAAAVPGPGTGSGAAAGSPERLVEWLRGAGLVPRGAEVPADGAWSRRFVELGAVVARLVEARLAGRAAGEGDVKALNDAALASPPAPRAVRAADGTLTRGLAGEPDCAGLLGAVARDALDLLTDPVAAGRLRRCEGDGCTLVYLDTSRGRRRRWCSSETCGNRERVARHRRRAVATATRV
ncbi:CGNR zinc finger domain-containing protein [Streptomyces sp. NPDC058691]|uniref:CGNR zinc finger domain-containing protein n=1 Tax=Streptomyces sp. NPDC058691 TaxID=3346601 RepID=UPI003660EB4C